jgi:hypothetical protein
VSLSSLLATPSLPGPTVNLRATPASVPPTPQTKSFGVRLNEPFKLDDYTYRVTYADTATVLDRHSASTGATYFIIHFSIRNDGQHAEQADVSRFRLLDPRGRVFEPSVMPPQSDLAPNPGILKKGYVAFEVPNEVTKASLKIIIRDKVVSGKSGTEAVLSLVPTHASSTAKQRSTRGHRTGNDEGISEEQRRLWRRMDRPWGTPWRSFSSEDEHGYPNN